MKLFIQKSLLCAIAVLAAAGCRSPEKAGSDVAAAGQYGDGVDSSTEWGASAQLGDAQLSYIGRRLDSLGNTAPAWELSPVKEFKITCGRDGTEGAICEGEGFVLKITANEYPLKDVATLKGPGIGKQPVKMWCDNNNHREWTCFMDNRKNN